MDYAIRLVYDAETAEMFDADKVFAERSQGYEFRKAYHTNDQTLRCFACDEKATIGISGKGTLHFKHFPETGDCILKAGHYTRSERKLIEEHLSKKEGRHHIRLKEAIAEFLKATEGVDIPSIIVDSKFLKDQREKRRPDVYCMYHSKTLAFEIQLSKLPPKYLFKRHEFYKRNGIFLIWILDDFDIRGQSQSEKDIKYLNVHQNFFYFNIGSPSPLVVQYKKMNVARSGKPYLEWTHDFVSLRDLTYETSDYQPYYVSLEHEQQASEIQLFKARHTYLFTVLRKFYQGGEDKYILQIDYTIKNLDETDFEMLEKAVGLGSSNSLLLRAAKDAHPVFLRYLLNHERFIYDVNTPSSDGTTILKNILLHKSSNFRWPNIYMLFARGYELTKADKEFVRTFSFGQETESWRLQYLIKLLVYNQLSERHFLDLYDAIDGPIKTILSAKYHRMIGFNLPNFISLANNAIDHYPSAFKFIYRAFHHYKLIDVIEQEDRHGTFKAKYQKFISQESGKHNEETEYLLEKLFPEITGSGSSDEWATLKQLGLSS